MQNRLLRCSITFVFFVWCCFSVAPSSAQTPSPTATPPPVDPYSLISRESMFGFLNDLTAIQPYSGWRNSGTEGEREAQDYVAKKLGEMTYLKNLGAKIERENFRVFMATELWESRLYLKINGRTTEVPASGMRGDRDNIPQALRFDSDGKLNDRERNPVTVDKTIALVRTEADVRALNTADAQNKIVFVDYAALDRSILRAQDALRVATLLVSKQPAAIVLVTQYSNRLTESHGAFIGDVNALNSVETKPAPPALYVRLEDLAPAGIKTWDDLARIESARLVWDADVLSPAPSGNVVAHIPGADSSRAIILGAHIDSPNCPGALDDGSGSAILLEIARVLNAARTQPPIDLYLVWFGSEELSLYGSHHFVSTHQDLLDRTVAMLQIDALSRPLDDVAANLELETWSYGRFGNDRLPLPEYLTQAVAKQGIKTKPASIYSAGSDNGGFGGFNVPNANLIYLNEATGMQQWTVHYLVHFHDPYDTVELAREVADVFEQMARVALTTVLEAGNAPNLRVTPPPTQRALFVASHTEQVHLSPATFTEFGMALALQGIDVDMVPYGRPVTADDLKNTQFVIVLPVLDYPETNEPYDEAWSPAEIAVLEKYVADGGLLLLTNTARRFKSPTTLYEANEDWSDTNALAERFGITFAGAPIPDKQARLEGASPLWAGLSALTLVGNNSVPFTMTDGTAFAYSNNGAVMAIKDYARGQVIALGDVGVLNAVGDPKNLQLWKNLASYVRAR